jgi:hypothetical protein
MICLNANVLIEVILERKNAAICKQYIESTDGDMAVTMLSLDLIMHYAERNKLDPAHCYVADLEAFTNIQDGKRRGWIRETDMETEAEEYWKGVIPLSDFLKMYR